MPRIESDTPKALKPYISLGLDLTDKGGQWQGDCPFCGKEGHWFVNAETSQWDCKSCAAKGNSSSFLEQFLERSLGITTDEDYAELARDRGLLRWETLAEWNLCRSILTREWLIPAYSASGKLCNLYRYAPVRDKEGNYRYRVQSLGGLNAGLFGPPGFLTEIKEASHVLLCEGCWDGMAAWEALGNGGGVGSSESSYAVVCTPGASTFLESWASLFADKHVYVLYDNDHGRTNSATGTVSYAAFEGVKRVASVLGQSRHAPAQVSRLCWAGDCSKECEEDFPDGYDVRDYLGLYDGLDERKEKLDALLGAFLHPITEDQLGSGTAYRSDDPDYCEECESWQEVVEAWRNSGLKWIDGLEQALSVMLACIISTEGVGAGSQLWARILSVPASGKTTLCEALALNKAFVKSVSVFTGFHSGVRGEDGKDVSLISTLKNKTLVIKDGDTLMKHPNKDQILAEMRDLYDRVSRTHYRTGTAGDYEGLNTTIILCGTGGLQKMDTAELGERYVTFSIIDEIDDQLEYEICRQALKRVRESKGLSANGKVDSQDTPAMTKARKLTGGYVGYLRRNADRLMDAVVITDEDDDYIVRLAVFSAHMRARPSKTQDETSERELGARLSVQFGRLALCLTAVLGKQRVDAEVLRIVRKCALDTSRGRVMRLCAILRTHADEGGIECKRLANILHEKEDYTRTLLGFLYGLGITHAPRDEDDYGIRQGGNPLWRLTPKGNLLWESVVETVL